ncbi:MAG TPA: class I SAM-dependent methyltransferase [Allosphingosinicella sp.]
MAEAVRALLPRHDRDSPVLLLGVTPELAAVPGHVIAVDWSARMIAAAWPGDSGRRKAVLGDWRRLPLERGSVGAAIGDGCFTMLRYPDEQPLLLEQLRHAVRPGGSAIIRCFATPEPGETVDEVRADAFAGGLGFHEFKLRFNMAVALEKSDGNICSQALFERFQAVFPDRAALSAATGWSLAEIAEVDAYKGSRHRHCYPSRRQLVELAPGARFVETGGYPLAERCPLLVVEFP